MCRGFLWSNLLCKSWSWKCSVRDISICLRGGCRVLTECVRNAQHRPCHWQRKVQESEIDGEWHSARAGVPGDISGWRRRAEETHHPFIVMQITWWSKQCVSVCLCMCVGGGQGEHGGACEVCASVSVLVSIFLLCVFNKYILKLTLRYSFKGFCIWIIFCFFWVENTFVILFILILLHIWSAFCLLVKQKQLFSAQMWRIWHKDRGRPASFHPLFSVWTLVLLIEPGNTQCLNAFLSPRVESDVTLVRVCSFGQLMSHQTVLEFFIFTDCEQQIEIGWSPGNCGCWCRPRCWLSFDCVDSKNWRVPSGCLPKIPTTYN